MGLKHRIARTAMAALVGAGVAIVPALAPVTAAADQTKKTETCTLRITGMTCGGCAVAVKMAAKKVDGVAKVTVSYENRRADVTYDPAKTTPEQIAKAITENSGFKAEVQPSSTTPAQQRSDQSETARNVSAADTSSRTLKVEGLPRRGQHL